jgi:hypothetical protein
MRSRNKLLTLALVLGIASSAQAGPAMFTASMIMPAFGNDITSGTAYPYNVLRTHAMPLGHNCQHASPYTPNGEPASRYCATTTHMNGYPATGSGFLVTGGATVGAPVGLPQSAFSVDVTGFHKTYYPYLQSWTWGDFANEAGTFFAGNGPAFGKGTVTHSGMGQLSGRWYIHEGARGFGGALGLLGEMGALHLKWVVPGKAGTWSNSREDWDMVAPLGREQYATQTGVTPMGKTLWQNPHIVTLTYVNNVTYGTSRIIGRGTGTPWTTGSVTLYANAGYFQTILHRTGFDTTTPGGVRNLQLVTPGIVHWIGTGTQTHTGHIGVLTLQITPEPGAILLLAAGGCVLALLYRVNRRS